MRLPVFVHILNNAASFLLMRFGMSSSDLSISAHVTLLIACPLLVAGTLVLLRQSGAAPLVASAPDGR
ncbi:hypothetical protein LY474_30545 [Myxococcus stipitatus]|uniref:hypothetical protein n=1 Tax=Myxococcus stipitatus TaxID=83455 RepID=UPI001F25E107|nr:hypothetical protein [Myxococcus stipitatus]MCE9672155.1 hypothetical protein [Myxococcus stipitatus]